MQSSTLYSPSIHIYFIYTGLATLTSDFQLCSPLADSGPSYRHLLLWLRNAFTNLAMFDYPYPVDFLGFKVPAFPVKVTRGKLR